MNETDVCVTCENRVGYTDWSLINPHVLESAHKTATKIVSEVRCLFVSFYGLKLHDFTNVVRF